MGRWGAASGAIQDGKVLVTTLTVENLGKVAVKGVKVTQTAVKIGKRARQSGDGQGSPRCARGLRRP